MGKTRTVLKTIDGVSYCYDKGFDIISEGIPKRGKSYNRTQTSTTVDLCVEITTECNLTCLNCFSNSFMGKTGRHLPYGNIESYLVNNHERLMRVALTGGEPLCCPDIAKYVDLPLLFPDLSYVMSTNGTLITGMNLPLVENGWLVAISLHGQKESHNHYTQSDSFGSAKGAIEALAPRGNVHIYCVLHHLLTTKDVDWLFSFRDDFGASYIRFIHPREFGRLRSLPNERVIEHVRHRLDELSGFKDAPSMTQFMTVCGTVRASN